MSNIVGIDLGVTNTRIVRLDETGQPRIQPNFTGNHITPSAVYIGEDDGNLEVITGEGALMLEDMEGKQIYKEFTRDIGKNKVYETVGGMEITPEILTSLLLQDCRRDFVAEHGDDITNCIITFPGNFNYERREATVYAGKSAGWPIHFGITETSAAALYYSLMHTLKAGKYAIYDLGRGTWDLSVVKIKGQEVNVIDTEGIPKCGGKDFDDSLQRLIEKKYKEETGLDIDYNLNYKIIYEDLKKSLSRVETRNIVIQKQGEPTRLKVTRDEFSESIASLLVGTEKVCDRLFNEHKDILDVILVGGSTRVPAVKKSVEKIFAKPGITMGNPEDAVALGAALYSGLKSDKKDLNAPQIDKLAGNQFNEVFEPLHFQLGMQNINKAMEEMNSAGCFLTLLRNAITSFDKHIQQNGVDAKSLLFRAKAHWFCDDKTKAKKDFELAEELDIDLVFNYFSDPNEESWMASVENVS